MELLNPLLDNALASIDELRTTAAGLYLGLLLAIGLPMTFAGVYIWHILAIVLGMLGGAVVGYAIPDDQAASLLGGALGLVLGVLVAYLIIVLGAAGIGAALGGLLAAPSGSPEVTVAGLVIGAVLAVMALNPVVILTTAWIGALTTTYAALNLPEYVSSGDLAFRYGLPQYVIERVKIAMDQGFGAALSAARGDLLLFGSVFLGGAISQFVLFYWLFRASDPDTADDTPSL